MVGYLTGVYDILRAKDLQKLDMAIQKNKESKNEYFALALYDEVLCDALGISKPLKSIEERMKIAEQLSGVDFVFSISSLDKNIIKKALHEAKQDFLKRKKENQLDKNNKKMYDIAYAPGTYDLFHAGHLENLLEAYEKSNILIVGVKSDELVESHKGRSPIIRAEERMEILRHFRFVDNVYQYYTRDPHIAESWIESKYHKKLDAIFLGSDLKKDFKDIKDINIVFTERDEKNMHNRSTTGYIKKLKLRTDNDNSTYKGKVKKNAQEKNSKSDICQEEK